MKMIGLEVTKRPACGGQYFGGVRNVTFPKIEGFARTKIAAIEKTLALLISVTQTNSNLGTLIYCHCFLSCASQHTLSLTSMFGVTLMNKDKYMYVATVAAMIVLLVYVLLVFAARAQNRSYFR